MTALESKNIDDIEPVNNKNGAIFSLASWVRANIVIANPRAPAVNAFDKINCISLEIASKIRESVILGIISAKSFSANIPIIELNMRLLSTRIMFSS